MANDMSPQLIHLWDQAKASIDNGHDKIKNIYLTQLAINNGDIDSAMLTCIKDVSQDVIDKFDAEPDTINLMIHNLIGIIIKCLVQETKNG